MHLINTAEPNEHYIIKVLGSCILNVNIIRFDEISRLCNKTYRQYTGIKRQRLIKKYSISSRELTRIIDGMKIKRVVNCDKAAVVVLASNRISDD